MSTLMTDTHLQAQILESQVQPRSLPIVQKIQNNMKEIMDIRESLMQIIEPLVMQV